MFQCFAVCQDTVSDYVKFICQPLKSSIMKKVVLLIVLMLSAWFAIAQQTPSDSLLMRKHGHLQFAGTSEKLNDAEVQSLLISSDFTKYKQARKEFIASIPLWALTGVVGGAAIYWMCMGIDGDIHAGYHGSDIYSTGMVGWMIAGFTSLLFLAPFIPALVLTIDSYKKLNRVANNYNMGYSPVSFKFGLTTSGIGLSLTF